MNNLSMLILNHLFLMNFSHLTVYRSIHGLLSNSLGNAFRKIRQISTKKQHLLCKSFLLSKIFRKMELLKNYWIFKTWPVFCHFCRYIVAIYQKLAEVHIIRLLLLDVIYRLYILVYLVLRIIY